MKRIIFLILCVFACSSLWAQDFNFMGVSLSQPTQNIKSELLQKSSLTKCEDNALCGDFWKFKDCNIYVVGKDNEIPRYVIVRKNAPEESLIKDLIMSFTKKYGTPKLYKDDKTITKDELQEVWTVGENKIALQYVINYDISHNQKKIDRSSVEITYYTKNGIEFFDILYKDAVEDDL